MNRFLRDGKRDKNEEGQGANALNGDVKQNDTEDVGDDAGGGGIREEVQGPNVPLKDINLDVFAKANGEKTNINEQNLKVGKISTQAKEINGKAEINEESSSDSKKCKYLNEKYKNMLNYIHFFNSF